MFKSILQSRKRSVLVRDALNEVVAMVERAEGMFGTACGALLQEAGPVGDQVAREDKEIHVGERLARRFIVEHLVTNPQQDLPSSVAILSIVHDVERLGDYCKSLVELSRWDSLRSAGSQYAGMCGEIHGMIQPLFGQTLAALREDDAELAQEVMRRHKEVKARTGALFAAAMDDSEANRETIMYVMASQYLRRASAHLSNIASSVANPLDQVAHNEVT